MSILRPNKPAPAKEVKAFRRGKVTSAKAAEQYAQNARDKAATKAAQKERREADKKAGRR